MKLLDELLIDDEDGEEKGRLIQALKDYVDGTGESLHRQAYLQSKNDDLALEAYNEEQDPQVDPPQKTKEVPVLFVLEKMMHQTGMLDASSSPSCTNTIDAYAQRYTLQDLVLVITLLSISLVKGKTLVMPQFPKDCKANATLKAKRQDELKEKKEKVSAHRDTLRGTLASVGYIKGIWDEVEDRLMADYSNFYVAMSKKTKSDNGKMMSVFTQSRVDAFAKWEKIGIGKNKKRAASEKVVDLTLKEKRRKKCDAIMNGTLGLKIGSDDSDDDASIEDWM